MKRVWHRYSAYYGCALINLSRVSEYTLLRHPMQRKMHMKAPDASECHEITIFMFLAAGRRRQTRHENATTYALITHSFFNRGPLSGCARACGANSPIAKIISSKLKQCANGGLRDLFFLQS
jgi:hypothetical protein